MCCSSKDLLLHILAVDGVNLRVKLHVVGCEQNQHSLLGVCAPIGCCRGIMDAQKFPRNVLWELLEDQAQVLVLLELGFANHCTGLQEVIHSGLGDLGLKDAHLGYQVQTCGRKPK